LFTERYYLQEAILLLDDMILFSIIPFIDLKKTPQKHFV